MDDDEDKVVPFPLSTADLARLIEKPQDVDMTNIAVGTGGAPEIEQDLGARESATFAWARHNFHDFVDRIRAADLEGPIAVSQIREYAMRQLIALTGHPDSKTAIKAIELLGKVKNVGLFDEKRSGSSISESNADEVRKQLGEIIQAFKK